MFREIENARHPPQTVWLHKKTRHQLNSPKCVPAARWALLPASYAQRVPLAPFFLKSETVRCAPCATLWCRELPGL